MRLLGCALLLAAATGCLSPRWALTQTTMVDSDMGHVEIAWHPNQAADEKAIRSAVRNAWKGLRQWGNFDRPISLLVMPTHLRLELAVRRAEVFIPFATGLPWLRAWGTYDAVLFQAPSSWAGKRPSDAEVNELVLHELTHCLMYQRASTPEDWESKGIPVWFREGMATWTANQGYMYPSLEELARYYEKHPDADPINAPEALITTEQRVVYTAAHHTFTFFIKRFGKQNVPRLLEGMHAGRTFAQAFELATGITAEAFGREMKRYVVWRGFKGVGAPKPSLLQPVPDATAAPRGSE